MLITSAGYGFLGTPDTLIIDPASPYPAAQSNPSNWDSKGQPHLPQTRTGRIFTLQATPATPSALLEPTAPIVPATWVPCHVDRCGLTFGPHSRASCSVSPS